MLLWLRGWVSRWLDERVRIVSGKSECETCAWETVSIRVCRSRRLVVFGSMPYIDVKDRYMHVGIGSAMRLNPTRILKTLTHPIGRN